MDGTDTTNFLIQLRDLYPGGSRTDSILDRPWYISAAVAFSASNVPEAIPQIFRYVLNQLPTDSPLEERRLLARKLREALFKSGLISGYPKVCGARPGIPPERYSQINRPLTVSGRCTSPCLMNSKKLKSCVKQVNPSLISEPKGWNTGSPCTVKPPIPSSNF